MSHASWSQILLFIFSDWRDILLYTTTIIRSQGLYAEERENRKTSVFLNYPYITVLSEFERNNH